MHIHVKLFLPTYLGTWSKAFCLLGQPCKYYVITCMCVALVQYWFSNTFDLLSYVCTCMGECIYAYTYMYIPPTLSRDHGSRQESKSDVSSAEGTYVFALVSVLTMGWQAHSVYIQYHLKSYMLTS